MTNLSPMNTIPSIEVSLITPTIDVLLSQQGPPGPPGPIGPPGEGTVIYLTADTEIGGHRVVKVTQTGCDYANNTIANDIGKIIGITESAFNTGDLVKIITSGEINEPSWNFNPGSVFLTTDGLLTQIPPESGFIQQVGIAIAPTKLAVQIQPAIKII